MYCFTPHVSDKVRKKQPRAQIGHKDSLCGCMRIHTHRLINMCTYAHLIPLEEMLRFLSQCPQRQILQVLLRASVHCCLNKSEVFSDCNCIRLWLKRSHRLKAVYIPLWTCFSDLSVQWVFLGLRTWHNMTCCQVSKHGVSGDETSANRKQIRNFVYTLIYSQ